VFPLKTSQIPKLPRNLICQHLEESIFRARRKVNVDMENFILNFKKIDDEKYVFLNSVYFPQNI
jgi:hypothetical protein